jgi:MerR family transcriptional regulator/heat shock protein HspR
MAHPVSSRPSSRGAQPSFSDLDKPLYTISVAAEILETHPRTLMLYEDANLIEPFRTPTNRRRYSQRDISKVQVIQHLTREKGVTLAGVRHILSLFETMKRHRVEPPPELREVFDRYSQII